jgi:hypothetical protein
MPLIDNAKVRAPSDRPDIGSREVLLGARAMTEVEVAMVQDPDAGPHEPPTALIRITTAAGRYTFSCEPLALVLIVQDMNDLLASRGGMVAVLRSALLRDDAPATEPAFEGAER